ncbi:E3 ubiquitin-protein ligase CHFR isoform X1 [Hemiscyllium ocellatum]|uniref:E3 ubiquitin-protein ligase CHFR isoform X1 n=1 Tax=Hemiscyllium ocellatum TaxID=170820 RepID=UPI00296705C5|nr:E3 ubiquitin-protein ligase CHFR isoform X1 [Hemiscyllium ocellatum]
MQSLESQAWGRLSRIDRESESHILLVNSEWTIGRKKGCDLSFPGNKLVSGDHCKIIREKTGQVWLEDTSTNGTVINKSKVVKKQTYPLQNGDAIYVVYRKNEPDQNVAYLYKALKSEEGIMEEPMGSSCSIFKETSSLDSNNDQTAVISPLCSKQAEHPFREEPQPCTSYYDPFCTSGANSDTDQPITSIVEPCTSSTEPVATTARSSMFAHGPKCSPTFWTSCPKMPSPALSPSRIQVHVESTSGPEAPKSSYPGALEKEEDLEPTKKKHKMETYGVSDPLLLNENQSSKITREDQVTSEGKQPDKMEETLTCIICQDLLHDCVSLQPCMHSFCAACYSGWMERSSLCPTCRCPVERISKNHMVNNLVEAYLLQHPEKCRSGDELQSMDARNKITHDMLQPKIKRSFSDEEVSSEDFLELSDVDSESSDFSQPHIVCRQCPGFRSDSNPPTFLPSFRMNTDAPSTSSSTPVAVQEYTCPTRGPHIICTCCFQPMPDRRAEREQNPTIAPQQCTICLRTFCHMYWGCTRVGCSGCLARFCDVNFGEKCLDGILNNNSYESDILKNYLSSRGLSWKEMLQESLLHLQRGKFVLTDYHVTTNVVLCYCCGLHNFRELAYQYRQNIPASELPETVTARPDCYWGRNCRTQVKAHHAMKFNHICEQTRFKN